MPQDFNSTATAILLLALLCFPLAAQTPGPNQPGDPRNIKNGSVIPDEGYGDQPYVVITAVAAEQQGFKRAVRSGIKLQVEQKSQVDLQLETGAVNETVEITGQPPLTDTLSATTGKVIESRRRADLPINGRNTPRTLPDVRTPGTVNWNVSFIKNTKLWERLGLQFRAEAFNALNHVNLGFPTTFVAGT